MVRALAPAELSPEAREVRPRPASATMTIARIAQRARRDRMCDCMVISPSLAGRLDEDHAEVVVGDLAGVADEDVRDDLSAGAVELTRASGHLADDARLREVRVRHGASGAAPTVRKRSSWPGPNVIVPSERSSSSSMTSSDRSRASPPAASSYRPWRPSASMFVTSALLGADSSATIDDRVREVLPRTCST